MLLPMMANPVSQDATWDFMRKNFEQLMQGGRRLGRRGSFLYGRGFLQHRESEEVKQFFQQHPFPGTERNQKEALEVHRQLRRLAQPAAEQPVCVAEAAGHFDECERLRWEARPAARLCARQQAQVRQKQAEPGHLPEWSVRLRNQGASSGAPLLLLPRQVQSKFVPESGAAYKCGTAENRG